MRRLEEEARRVLETRLRTDSGDGIPGGGDRRVARGRLLRTVVLKAREEPALSRLIGPPIWKVVSVTSWSCRAVRSSSARGSPWVMFCPSARRSRRASRRAPGNDCCRSGRGCSTQPREAAVLGVGAKADDLHLLDPVVVGEDPDSAPLGIAHVHAVDHVGVRR